MANQITPNPSVPSQVVAEVKFPKFINNLGIIPTSYKDSMSYYECLAWLCKFLEEQVIPTVNENGEAVEELQNLFAELNSYVANYFSTLDVQEEINNKLDDMVEAGTLQEIIGDYLNSKAVFGFETIEDMKESTNLIKGSYAQTLGYDSINDGGSSLYIIDDDESLVPDNKTIIELDSGLKAILTKQNSLAHETSCVEYIDNETNTKYWITHAPHKDQFGNVLKLNLGFADDQLVASGYLESPVSFANRHNATICVNAGVCDNYSVDNTGYKFGLRMKNRVLISNRPSTKWQIHWALGIKENNELVSFGPTQTEEEALELGCVDVTSAFTPILLNGVSQKFQIEYTDKWYKMNITSDSTPVSTKTYYTHNNTAPYYTSHTNLESFTQGITYYEITNEKYQRQTIGQNSTTGDIYFITTNGKGSYIDQGITMDKIVQIYQSLGCDFAYQLDGGGSTALIYKGEMKNQFTDDDNTKIRLCGDFLYIGYENMNTQSEDINYINARFGEFTNELKKSVNYNLSLGYALSSGDDLNNIKDVGTYYTPSGDIADSIINIPNFSSTFSFIQDHEAFKLIVNRIKPNIIHQTLIYESDKVPIFVRELHYNYGSQTYVWTNWQLVNKENVQYSLASSVVSGFTINNGLCRRKDNRVLISAEITGTFNSHNPTDIITLPNGLKPSLYIMCAGVGIDNSSHVTACQITIQTNGTIRATCPTGCTKVRFSASFDVD